MFDLTTKEGQIAAVNYDIRIIKAIKNPCLEAQLAAVQRNGFSIEYIKNPCLKVQLAALRKDRSIYRRLKDPGIEAKRIFVRSYPIIISQCGTLIKVGCSEFKPLSFWLSDQIYTLSEAGIYKDLVPLFQEEIKAEFENTIAARKRKEQDDETSK